MFFYLAFKNVVSRKSSALIILFIAFSLSIMTLINFIFDGTENGIEQSYSRSFTGDFIVRANSNVPVSLFGDETPITGKLTTIETLKPYSEIYEFLKSCDQIEKIIPQVTGNSFVEYKENRVYSYIFGILGEEYFDFMSSLKILEGKPFRAGERGAIISENLAKSLGVTLQSEIQAVISDGITFRIRAVPVTAIYSYPSENEVFSKIVLFDPFTVRSLMGINETSDLQNSSEDFLDFSDFEMDAIFEDAIDVDAIIIEENFTNEKEKSENPEKSEKNKIPNEKSEQDSNSWNFLIGSVKSGENVSKIIRTLNREFKKNAWPCKAVNWRIAAGSQAMYLYWIRIIFNAGVIIILIAGFIVINNALIVGILNRTQEIGTMRAQGASRIYISLLCMTETFILTFSGGILGCAFGSLFAKILSLAKIRFSNNFIIQLFGSKILFVKISFGAIINSLIISLVLAFAAWIYPVRTALKISPVKAMQGGS